MMYSLWYKRDLKVKIACDLMYALPKSCGIIYPFEYKRDLKIGLASF